MQHFLKALSRSARAGIVPSEFFDKLFITVDHPVPLLNLCFRRESFPSLAHEFKRGILLHYRISISWYTS